MGALQVDDDRLIFAALGLVDGGGVGQIQHFKVASVILGNSAIAEINGQHTVGVITGDGCDITDIAIADVLAVFICMTLSPKRYIRFLYATSGFFPSCGLSFPEAARSAHSRPSPFLAVWGQKRHIVNTVSGGFL